jgi:3-oxoacyl-(acyl-carrier-protein) synthase III
VIFVSSGGGDLAFPATANLVTAALGLAGTCDCFDLNNACMGFLTALDLAARSIVTGCGPIGIVVAELASRVITPLDPRPYLVFGDGVAAAVVTPAEKEAGILGIALWNDGIAFGNVRLTNPTMSGRTETIRFTASHAQMGAEAVDAVRRSTAAVLAQAGMSMDDVDWVLPHQPNGALLAAMIEALAVPESRVIPIVGEVGSVGAASIPLSLDRLFRETEVRRGARILMVGVGGGISSGALLYRVGT